MKTISLRIDGELISGREGQTILESAREHGKYIPTLCYLKGLSATGACRVCMVEMAGTDKLLGACTTPVQDGMSIRTTSSRLEEYRRMVVELLLAERNHVCSVCTSNGHCEFQTLVQLLKISHVRYPYNNPRLAVDMTHPRYLLDQNRCVLCTRCVRVCAELECAHVWEISARGIRSRLVSEMAEDWGATNCTGCGKCVQACPTGALVEKGVTVNNTAKNNQMITLISQRRIAAHHQPGSEHS